MSAEGRPRTSSLANLGHGQGATSTSSGGRVITIRTNRRMITITQGCRQGEMRPIEILSLPPINPASAGSKNTPLNQEFDLTSFENDFSVSVFELIVRRSFTLQKNALLLASKA